jgi:pimeloyl-ACP methyl ester carboxylesterase
MMQKDEGVLTLPDGRRLGYAAYGPPDGHPILHFHGTPGSRLEAALLAEYLQREDVLFLCMDRPGYGRSSMQRGWRISGIPDDAACLLDHMGIERAIVTGYSGGGPFALACAWKIPRRIHAVGVISGVGPAETGSGGMHEANRRKFDLAQRMPRLAELLIRVGVRSALRRPGGVERMLQQAQARMPQVDRDVFRDARFSDWMVRETRDALAFTSAGLAHEEVLMASAWGFRLEDIRHPHIHLWHGTLDCNVPITMGRAVASRIPGCQASFFEDEGHISLIYRRGKEILGSLLEFSL